jgi:hypothetical protein
MFYERRQMLMASLSSIMATFVCFSSECVDRTTLSGSPPADNTSVDG